MTTTTTTTTIAEATWQEYTIPGSEPAVALTRLSRDRDGGFTVLVRFPTGWSRPGPGHYDAIEEVTFLAGSFEMSGRTYHAGDYAWFPAGYTRTASRAPVGALALAWFSGANRWTEAVSPQAEAAEEGFVTQRWTTARAGTSPLGLPGWPLRVAADRQTWVIEEVPSGTAMPTGVEAVDVFDLASHRWHTVRRGEQLPTVAQGPALVRLATPDRGA